MFSPEIASVLFGSASGFLFKMISTSMENKQKQFEMLIKRGQEADISADKASKRDIDGGKITRRIIVTFILFAVIAAPFILSILGIATVTEIKTPERSWLGGLIETGGKIKLYSINGYLISQELKIACLSLISYYFGQSAFRTR